MTTAHHPEKPIVLIDDEQAALTTNEIALSSAGLSNVITMQDGRQVFSLLSRRECSVVVLDLNMPEVSGKELLKRLSENWPQVAVVIVTGENTVETAVECMKLGAFDYLVKPVEEDRLSSVIKRALELQELRQTSDSFHERLFSGTLNNPAAFADILTESPLMFTVFQYLESVAPSSQPLLITGETGTGKELLSKAVHTLSGRSGEFVAENLAGLDDTMFADTLFGHLKGAYTGADSARMGLVERANGGTLLLDEIGDIKPASQIKLLRFLQEREFYPLGSDSARSADVRIVAATNRSTDDLQKDPDFRNDLYFRLKTHHVHIPPLRKRTEDLKILSKHFIEEAARDMEKTPPTPPTELFTLLKTYSFPGNIRELRAMIYDAVGKHSSKVLSMASFREAMSLNEEIPQVDQQDGETIYESLESLPTIQEATRELIEEAMRRSDGNQSIAARLLGITPSSLSKRLKRQNC